MRDNAQASAKQIVQYLDGIRQLANQHLERRFLFSVGRPSSHNVPGHFLPTGGRNHKTETILLTQCVITIHHAKK
jgi:hypothetical protein